MEELDSMYYVYKHYLNDKLFYIGKGCRDRAYDFKDRSLSWSKLVAGNFDNIRVEIVGYFKSELYAYEVEKLLIKKYNTKDVELTNHVYNPVKNDLIKDALSSKSENEPLIINGRSSYRKFFDYGENCSPLNALESIENLNEGVSIFIDSASSLLTKMKDELVVNGYTPLLVMPESKYIDKPSKTEEKDIFEFRTRGVISNKYNCVIVDSCFIDEIEINLKKVNAVIINTTIIRNRNKALLSFNGQADFLICKMKESSNMFYNLPSSIVDKYLNIPLDANAKNAMCKELNIKRESDGKIVKWTTISKVLINEGYIIKNSRKIVNGKQVRVSLITLRNDSEVAPVNAIELDVK